MLCGADWCYLLYMAQFVHGVWCCVVVYDGGVVICDDVVVLCCAMRW
jgi:hypothetical protein